MVAHFAQPHFSISKVASSFELILVVLVWRVYIVNSFLVLTVTIEIFAIERLYEKENKLSEISGNSLTTPSSTRAKNNI